MRFVAGQKVTWFKPKNGMIGPKRIPAIVRGYTRSRISIEAELPDGRIVVRYVKPEDLIGAEACV